MSIETLKKIIKPVVQAKIEFESYGKSLLTESFGIFFIMKQGQQTKVLMIQWITPVQVEKCQLRLCFMNSSQKFRNLILEKLHT